MPLYKVRCINCKTEAYISRGMFEDHTMDCECGYIMKQVIEMPMISIKKGKNDPRELTQKNWDDLDVTK